MPIICIYIICMYYSIYIHYVYIVYIVFCFTITGLKKKLANHSKVAKYRSIAPWIKSTCNHLYWCVWSSGYEEEREVKWKFLLNHLTDNHEDCNHTGEIRPKNWIVKGICITEQFFVQ